MKKEEQNYHSISIEKLFENFVSSKKGLSFNEAKIRLSKYGQNKIEKIQTGNVFKIIFEQFNSFLIYLLLISSIILFVLQKYLDASVILAIVFLNSGIGFFQQYKAEKAINSLKKLIIPKSKIMREGKLIEIPSTKIVPGDIIFLSKGDKITADCRIIKINATLQTNEAVLTGESNPIEKAIETLDAQTQLADRKNMLFTGTQVVKGSCVSLVVKTGMQTVFGNIAKTLQEIEETKTPMQKRLNFFSKQLGLIIIGLVIIISFIGFFQGLKLFEMFLVAVTLAIGAIPEGLPAVLAIAFSISSLMLSKNKVIIRKLPAIETLGSVTVICSDKTGTITQEQMSVQKVFLNGKIYDINEKQLYLEDKLVKSNGFLEMVKTSLLCNDSRYEIIENKKQFLGDPTEEAFVRLGLDFNLDKKVITQKQPTIAKFEFNSDRKMMSKIRDKGRNKIIYTKGASENVLAKCSFELIEGQIKNLTMKRKEELISYSQKMEGEALRVLGFAYKSVSKKTTAKEEGLIFQGFMGMIDPPRPEVKKAIAECKSAGIDVKIITGDSPLTAEAISNQIGITGRIITQNQLEKMSDIELSNQIKEISIFARTTPHQKLRITKILQGKGEIVAITGDGINDVLALKAADIGIAMGKRGTDVARDVSDIVLIDDNFASLVEGVKQGRKTYDNIKKFTKYVLSVNFSTIFLVGFLIILGMPLPITPLLILWKNLITDSFPALTLVFEKEENVMKTKPRKEKSILDGIWKFIIFGGFLNFFACLITYLVSLKLWQLPLPEVQTMVATTGIAFELLFVYTCRSKRPLTKIGIFSNKWLNIAVVSAFALHLILLYTPLAVLFNAIPMSVTAWKIIIPLGFSGLIISEIVKTVKKTRD
ncbi:MAG: HAD-IC family P-type ATPase [Nanoarchaeota archaeon]|nr:HAD-IC family P-type ATPase [Nanoarchaeota archaeon]